MANNIKALPRDLPRAAKFPVYEVWRFSNRDLWERYTKSVDKSYAVGLARNLNETGARTVVIELTPKVVFESK